MRPTCADTAARSQDADDYGVMVLFPETATPHKAFERVPDLVRKKAGV